VLFDPPYRHSTIQIGDRQQRAIPRGRHDAWPDAVHPQAGRWSPVKTRQQTNPRNGAPEEGVERPMAARQVPENRQFYAFLVW